MRPRLRRITGALFLLNWIATWLDVGFWWKFPIVLAMMAGAFIVVAEDRSHTDGHVTLNLRG